MDEALTSLCEQLGLQIVGILHGGDGGSKFLAHVLDASGRHLVIKRSSGLRGYGELRVLQAWSNTPHVPRHLRALDNETFLCEFIEGPTLDQVEEEDLDSLLPAIGRMARELHAAAPPDGLMPLARRVSPEWVRRDFSDRLPAAMVRLAETAARSLASHKPADARLLHGDLVPGNIIVAAGKPVVIDPIGFAGPASWDLAQLAVAIPGRDRRANLAGLIVGYAEEPPLREAAFAYLALMFLDKNLAMERDAPGTRTRYVEELSALAEQLL